MDADELRKSMIQEVKQTATKAEHHVETSRLLDSLIDQATAVRTRYRTTTHGRERRKLDDIYKSIDKLIGQIKGLGAIEDAGERAARSKTLDEDATSLIDKARSITESRGALQERIEKGRREVLEKAAPGAGANTQKRFRDELNFLWNNYSPYNDNKIETLINKWRRSGDPSYDPAIKLRYRNVRKKKTSDDYAF